MEEGKSKDCKKDRRNRYGLTWFDQPEDAWKKVSPKIAKKIEELEKRLKIVESRWIDDGR